MDISAISRRALQPECRNPEDAPTTTRMNARTTPDRRTTAIPAITGHSRGRRPPNATLRRPGDQGPTTPIPLRDRANPGQHSTAHPAGWGPRGTRVRPRGWAGTSPSAPAAVTQRTARALRSDELGVPSRSRSTASARNPAIAVPGNTT